MLEQRYLAEYRAAHHAVIVPKRTRGKALLGTGIAFGAVGVVMLIVGGALAVHKHYDWDRAGIDDNWVTQPYRSGGLITVGAGAGMVVLGGGLIAAGAVPLTEANSHERAIGGNLVSFAR